MEYRTMLRLQKCLHINVYLSITWVVVVAFFLYSKLNHLEHLTRYITVTVFILIIIIETGRLYIGQYGNLSCSVGIYIVYTTMTFQSNYHKQLHALLTGIASSIAGPIAIRVPELAGFLMLTVLMQMPLISFFLFNPYLMSTPLEFALHTMLWFLALAEAVFSFIALKQASSLAKHIYLSQSRTR